ncbi:carbohydrate porin [Bacteroidota bacterium]
MKNLKGGINTDFAYIGMEEVGITLDLEAANLWKGGSFFLHGLNTHGKTPSSDIVGDLQVASNIESGNYVGLYEYYYQHSFGNFSVLIGQHDLNSEFVGTEYGGTFINSSFGISPSISLNIPVSIYPFAALSSIIKYEIENRYVARLGVYDGDPGDPESNRYNLQPNVSMDEGLLFIGEFEKYHFVNNLPENYKLGGYYHTSSFLDYNDTLSSVSGNYGIYAVSDMVLWSGFNHPHTYIGIFLQGGWAPGKINQINGYLGGGLHLNGILPMRFNDVLGIAFAYANISTPFRTLCTGYDMGELALEFTYKIHMFKHYSIQPNVQYIMNPGANSGFSNALVAMIRFNVSLANQ